MLHPDFNALTSLWHGLRTFLKAAVAVTAAAEGMTQSLGIPNDWDTFKIAWPGYMAALLFALVKTVENVRRNGNGPDNPTPMWFWGDVPEWFMTLIGLFKREGT